MRIIKIFMFAALCLSANLTYAMFCPNNFNEINIGETLAAVQAKCGKGIAKTHDDTAQQPQEWVYFTKASPGDQTSLRMTIFFDKGIVTNMTVNNVGVATTQICGGNSATVGATEKVIKTACGAPAYVRQGNNPGGKVDTSKITEVTYPGTPPIVLTFVDGLLKSRQ